MCQKSIQLIHQETLEVLDELERICKQMNITYFITAGTLLGAVRHKGFIPWDDDADVVMFRKDYERFSLQCSNFVSNDFYFQDHHSFVKYPLGFAKLRKKNSSIQEKLLIGTSLPNGAFVDIFPLDICPNTKRIAKLFFMGTNIVNAALLTKAGGTPWNYGKKALVRIAYWFMCKLSFKKQIRFRDFLQRISARFGNGSCLCTVSGRHGFPKESYNAEWFESATLLQFENRYLSAPVGWAKLLERMYGDYMIPQKEEEHIIENK